VIDVCSHGEETGGEKYVIESACPEVTAKIRTGRTVFLQRNGDSDSGRVIDLFTGCRYVGSIEQDFENGGLCAVYRAPDDHPQGEPILLTPEDVDLDTAARILKESAVQ
jgi:hypothetical protein